jgi:hypothetical protein
MNATTIAPRYSAHWSGLRMSKTPMASRLPKKAARPAHSATSWRRCGDSAGFGGVIVMIRRA